MKRINIQPERVAIQRAKWRDYMDRVRVRRDKKPRPVPEWTWAYRDQGGVIAAWTRSEARAGVKEVLRVKRMPKEVELVARTQ